MVVRSVILIDLGFTSYSYVIGSFTLSLPL